jgi:glutathionyl-hydroquinone reductase
MGGRPFGDGTPPGPVRPEERVAPAHNPVLV